MKRVARVNKGECISCGVCVDTVPAVFRFDAENLAEVYDPNGGGRGGDPGGDRPLPGDLHLLGRVTVSGTVAGGPSGSRSSAVGIARADPSGWRRIRTRSPARTGGSIPWTRAIVFPVSMRIVTSTPGCLVAPSSTALPATASDDRPPDHGDGGPGAPPDAAAQGASEHAAPQRPQPRLGPLDEDLADL